MVGKYNVKVKYTLVDDICYLLDSILIFVYLVFILLFLDEMIQLSP